MLKNGAMYQELDTGYLALVSLYFWMLRYSGSYILMELCITIDYVGKNQPITSQAAI